MKGLDAGMNLFGKYTVIDGDRPIGELEIMPKGSLCRFKAMCSTGRTGIFRLGIRSRGRLVPVGVMVPYGNGWGLDRTYSTLALRQMGIETVEGAEIIGAESMLKEMDSPSIRPPEPIPRQINKTPPESQELTVPPAMDKEEEVSPSEPEPAMVCDWQREPEPERLFKDPDIKRACMDMTDTLVCRNGELTYLAVPIIRGRPFPALPIFCFGSSMKINGNNYVVFKIKDGVLHL
jgi:hypothetical protein